MNIIIILLAFFGATFALKETSLLNRPRSFLISLHPFFYNLLECYFCTGFWGGIFIYFCHFSIFSFREMIIYGLASAALSFLLNLLVDKLLTLK